MQIWILINENPTHTSKQKIIDNVYCNFDFQITKALIRHKTEWVKIVTYVILLLIISVTSMGLILCYRDSS